MEDNMTIEEREVIVSEDYADLLIEYNGDLNVFEQFPDAIIHFISGRFAVLHIPEERITDSAILEFGYSAMPTCYGIVSSQSLEASGVVRLRNQPVLNLRGSGVLIGIIDTGIDYTNPIFQYADGTTRIAYIWDQTIQGDNYPEGTFYGTEYTREDINAALQSENPLEIVPSTDEIGHGTMVAGIAAGNPVPESDFYGIANSAEFVVVKLKPAKAYLKRFFCIPEDAICYQENDVLFGIQYLTQVAFRINRPMAICVAIGSSQGAHDGRGLSSTFVSSVAAFYGIAVVVAAGNEGNARRHFYSTIDPAVGYVDVELLVGENEGDFFMELWGNAPDLYYVDVLSPSGEYIPRIIGGLTDHRAITFLFESTILLIDYNMVESQSGDQLILFRFRRPAPGIWRFRVYQRGDLEGAINIWLPKEGFISNNTYFVNSNPYTTLLNLANTMVPITITAYNSGDNSLYLAASRGYARTNFIVPDLAAPGINIVAPTLNHGFTEVTGTSAAAAHTTGIAALMLEWGVLRENHLRMNSLVIGKLLIRGARRDPELEYPNRDWGYGILDIFNAFDRLRS